MSIQFSHPRQDQPVRQPRCEASRRSAGPRRVGKLAVIVWIQNRAGACLRCDDRPFASMKAQPGHPRTFPMHLLQRTLPGPSSTRRPSPPQDLTSAQLNVSLRLLRPAPTASCTSFAITLPPPTSYLTSTQPFSSAVSLDYPYRRRRRLLLCCLPLLPLIGTLGNNT